MSGLSKHPASCALVGALGSLALSACGPVGPSLGETGDSSGGATEPTTDPTTDPTDPTDATTTPSECQVDADCNQDGCGGYCFDGSCQPGYGCCDHGVEPTVDGAWRCTPPPYYECYTDEECADGYVCTDNICLPSARIPLPACRPPDAEVTQWNLGEAPDAFVLVDLDLDQDLDLAAVQAAGGTLELALNDGLGGFTSTTAISVGAGIRLSLASGDVDNDGDVDLVVARDNPDGGLQLLFNDGGLLQPGLALASDLGPEQVFLADANGDGALDLLSFSGAGLGVGLRLGDGAGEFFVEQPAFAAQVEPRASVVDVSGDGVADVLAPLSLAPAAGVWLGAIEGFVETKQFTTVNESGSLLAADLDLQGSSDVVVVEQADDGGLVEVWLSVSPLAWQGEPFRYQTASPLRGGVLGELDAMPGGDLVAATGAANVVMLPGDGRGGFLCEHVQATTGVSAPSLVAVGDVDGDGRMDIVAGGAGSPTITMVLLK